jgi:hypothetical protein
MQMSRKSRIISFALAALTICLSQLFVPTNALTDGSDFPTIDRRYTMGSDWVLSLNITKLNKMFVYPGSTLYPLIQVRVSYFTRDPNTHLWSSGQVYEDLWFHNGMPIGCKRYTRLPFKYGSYGVITLLPTQDGFEQTKSVDDTVLRLYMDLTRLNCIISSTVLPLAICDNAATELGYFNFYRATMVTAGTVILLHYVSTPQGFDNYYCFKTK